MDENYFVVSAIVLGVVKPYGCVAEPPQNHCVALTSVVVYKLWSDIICLRGMVTAGHRLLSLNKVRVVFTIVLTVKTEVANNNNTIIVVTAIVITVVEYMRYIK